MLFSRWFGHRATYERSDIVNSRACTSQRRMRDKDDDKGS
jgi:hypothetical protein